MAVSTSLRVSKLNNKTGRKKMKWLIKQSLAAAMIVVAGVLPAMAAEYVMSVSADYSGPFADVMPNAMSRPSPTGGTETSARVSASRSISRSTTCATTPP
jgi:hypothetical protein